MKKVNYIELLFVGLIFVMFSSQLALAGILGYSVASNFNDHLYQIDLQTGAAADLGLVNFDDAEGLSFAGNTLYAIGGSADELWNITTPPGSKVGDTGTRFGTDAGLDYYNATSTMYNLNADLNGSSLYTVNLTSGATNFIGSSSIFGDGLAIDSGGNAFAVDGIFTDSLYSVNLSTGGLSIIGSLGITSNDQFGLSFGSDGLLYGINDNGEIYKFNTTNGAATFQAFANSAPGARLTGFEGLATKPIPEPATMILFGTGLAGLIGLRIRRKK